MATTSFKHYYKSSTTIGSGTIKFIPYTATEPLTQLATPQNVTANGTTVSWDEVANATSYEIYADGVSIGTVDGGVTNYLLDSTGNILQDSNGNNLEFKEA